MKNSNNFYIKYNNFYIQNMNLLYIFKNWFSKKFKGKCEGKKINKKSRRK